MTTGSFDISPQTDEAALVADLRAGSETAFERLVRAQAGRMVAVARRLLGNESDADDAVQEALLSAFKSIDRFEASSSLGTWLYRIVVNTSLMKLRSRKRRREWSIDDLLPTYYDDGHRQDPRSAWTATSDDLLGREETRAMIRTCIDELPEDYRNALLLREIEGLDTDRTAETLDVTSANVKTRLHRARQALRTLLERELTGAAS